VSGAARQFSTWNRIEKVFWAEGLPQPPYVPGLEVAGTVRELGDGVDGLSVGEPVVTLSGTGAEGGYAEITAVDARFAAGLGSSKGARRCSCTAPSAGWHRPFPGPLVASAPRGLSGPSARRVGRYSFAQPGRRVARRRPFADLVA